MTSIKSEKNALRSAITQWYRASVGPPSEQAWRTVEDAILALDNAAYDRAYEQLSDRGEALERELGDVRKELFYRKGCAKDWHQTAIDRANEIERLKQACNSARQYGYDLRKAENTYLLGERDRLKQDLEFTEHRREQAEKELAADAEHRNPRWLVKLATRLLNERDEARAAQTREAADLRKALETLADRYHEAVCSCGGRKSRQGCDDRPFSVKVAEKALAGESESPRFDGRISNVASWARVLSPGEVKARALADYPKFFETDDEQLNEAERQRSARRRHTPIDDRKPQGWWCIAHRTYHSPPVRGCVVGEEPKEQPEIEAVLMGNNIKCSSCCGCDRVVDAGQCAYRMANALMETAPLFATEECARKAARPKARTHPPYAAYTDAMRREERDCRS